MDFGVDVYHNLKNAIKEYWKDVTNMGDMMNVDVILTVTS